MQGVDIDRRWAELVAPAADATLAGSVLAKLRQAYGEPWRHYHTLQHIQALLGLRIEHAALIRDPELVDLAILFHDIVYDPRRMDNEAQSAILARARLDALGVEPGRIEAVVGLIQASKHDTASFDSVDPASDAAVFLDLGLSILAAERDAYTAYADQIRREYALYPDPLYRAGRAKVLAGLLARPALYCTRALGERWELPARANLLAEINGLTAAR